MKKSYKLALLGAAAITLCAAGSAFAFHDGGVARCNGCHTMHNSELNAAITDIGGPATQFTTGPMLLRAEDRSGACLNCHGEGTDNHSYHVYTEESDTNPNQVPEQFGPGGDFAWNVLGTIGGATKERRGHGITAAAFGLVADTTITTSPGGTYPGASLACSSCHDPHAKYRVIGGEVSADPATDQVTQGAPIVESGSYTGVDVGTLPSDEAVGVYRFLGGVGYNQKSTATTADAFVNPAPVAKVASSYNSPSTLGGVRVAYGQGMSEWCANCHGSIHNSDYPTNLRHPAGNDADLTTAIADNYNAYVNTGDKTGTSSDSYLALVPFETGQAYDAIPALDAVQTSTVGPAATDNVMCLSCHRAHATAFESMLRWDYQASPFMVLASGDYHLPDIGLTQEQVVAGYYNKPAADFGAYQRSLCNKCHDKD
jgi:predicted CXXCH cytochrome family protein